MNLLAIRVGTPLPAIAPWASASMPTPRRFIVAIGRIPPMAGLAYITSEYIKLLAEDHEIRVLNISPKVAKRGVAYHRRNPARSS